MRKAAVAFILLFVAWLGYVAWPITTLATLARAVEARRHRDRHAARRPAGGAAIAHRPGGRCLFQADWQDLEPAAARRGHRQPASFADPIVGRIAAPQGIVEFLRDGWPSTVLPERPAGVSGLSSAAIGNAWQIFGSAEYGIRRFEIEVPPSLPRERRFVLEFRLIQWRWQLTGVRMPEHLRVRLAEELNKLLKR